MKEAKKIRTRKAKCAKCQEVYLVPGPGCRCLQSFSWPIQVGAGGTEVPYLREGTWFIRVWNAITREYFAYNFSTDLFEADHG